MSLETLEFSAKQIALSASCESVQTRSATLPGETAAARTTGAQREHVRVLGRAVIQGYALLLMIVAMCAGITGCGSSGYAGAGITGLSTSAVTIDAGQQYPFKASLSGNTVVSWAATGSNCSSTTCGSLSSTNGTEITYTAPAGITSQMKVTLTASVAGTTNLSVATITVNPDPVISGTPASGTVGSPYSTTFTATGGTAPLTWSMSGVLPTGLSFNPATRQISGTPTAAGSSSVTLQVLDSSAVPFTVNASEAIVITAPGVTVAPLVLIAGNPPAGTVGVPYTTSLKVSGGVMPYDFGLVSGSLPAGLTLSAATGTISGTPTATGSSAFTAQVQDGAGTKASAAFSIQINPAGSPLKLNLATLPGATVGVPYSALIGVSGGTAPYTCLQAGGSLPAGLLLSSACVVSGTPTTAGTSTVTVKASDSTSPTAETVTGPESITVTASTTPISLALATLPGATVGVPYSALVGVSGGTAPYTCLEAGGSLPSGLSLSSSCLVSGTPTAAGAFTVMVKASDSSNPANTITGPESIMVTASTTPLSLTMATLPGATVGVPYNALIGVSGGTAPYTCLQAGGTLPAGLSLSATCVVSGTPTAAGTSTVTVTATDSTTPTAATVTGPESITVTDSTTPISLTLATLPGATLGVPYSALVGVAGGTSPYTCQQAGGTLPAGLSLSSSCLVTGTPTIAGTFTVMVMAGDSSNPANTTTGPETITVTTPLSLTMATLPGATVGVPYSALIGVSGGTAPYSCQQAGGSLPSGLSLSAACVVSGTPTTAGTSTVLVTATDSSSPVETVTGPEAITVTASTAPLMLTLATLPNATVGTPYSALIGVTGGTAPYSCQQVGGTLPAGLTLSTSCVVSGTPTAAGTSTLMVKASDSSTPTAETVTGPESITVSAAALTLSLSNLPNATVGTPYSGTIGVSGGTAPYNCTLLSGTLPAGLTISGCVVSGTPTVAGTVSLGVKATDSANPANSGTGPVGLTVSAAAVTLTITSPPAGTVGTPYSGPIGVAGGTAPYTCTLVSGTLPAGLTLNGCTITGTPTAQGTSTVTVKATDGSNPAATTTGPVTVTINPATATLTLTSPPAATVSVPYTGTIGVSGGTSPYTCTLSSGTLPAGLTLATNCVVSGTPTTAGTTVIQVHAVDSANPVDSTTGPVTITVSPIAKLTLTGSVPNATLGVPYTQTLQAAGGVTPYTFSVSAGALPAGLTLSTAGVISGTPTVAGASSFTATVTDTEATPQTASLPLVLLVVYPTTPNDAELVGPYAYLFQGYDDVVAGVLAYQTATVASFTADGTGVVSAGEMDSNHQSSNPAGNTISSNLFLGTYTIGTNNQGSLTITTLHPNGTTNATSTYAITVKAPVAPATVATQADLIEFDDNNLQGTKGSGSMLAQQATAFADGLKGSYAFGMSGDTPCLPACTVGISAGPVASVGQFLTDGAGSITSGTSDANIATTNYAKAALSGTYATADANGRLDLSMETANTPAGIYPSDYAVYLVSANQAFILSTDKHSDYVLLAGTAQLQTQATFSNGSLGSALIGYENAPTNPGLLGTTLSDTLNLSTATIFRATGNGVGTCDTTNVDVGGLTSLVNGLTGLGSGSAVLNAVLGTYESTGNSTCTVAANGRGVLNYPAPNSILTSTLLLLGLSTAPPAPRELYLVSPNSGYFLETGYAGLGHFEAQTGAPFSLATLDGTYVYASQPASSVASINGSGTLVSKGNGSATTTQDLNVGVGTINLLETGVTSTQNYTLTSATSGRYLLGTTTVIYAISPGRFVLVDTNPATTSPSISLLY